jgi:hypothetical protein
VLSKLRLIAPEGMGSECPDILVCGICRMYFNDICDLAKHKVECHGGTGEFDREFRVVMVHSTVQTGRCMLQ